MVSESANNKMGYEYRNVGWYRKHFRIPSDWKGDAIFLYIEGCFHETTAWINGVEHPSGTHMGGYTSFW